MSADFLSQFGTTDHKKKLLNLDDGRAAMAKNGTDEDRETITKHLCDTHNWTRAGSTTQVLSPGAKSAARHIATLGTDSQRTRLMGTTLGHEEHTACALAQHGDKSIKDELVSHPSPRVRTEVAFHGDSSHRDKLVKDPDSNVRIAVAQFGNDNHHKALMNDPDVLVRRRVIGKTENPDIISHMHTHDPDEMTKKMAHNRPQEISKRKAMMKDFFSKHGNDPLLKTESLLNIARNLV